MKEQPTLKHLPDATSKAVAKYWSIRKRQQDRQKQAGRSDQGARGAVTGGAQMDGFIELFTDLVAEAGIERQYIFYHTALQLPGFFRPTKEWDLLVVHNGRLILGLEAKSQVGPSFGNNFNNRTEEAMGSALDLWTAFREGAFKNSSQPFLGYFFMLEDCPASTRAVRVQEPHFKVFPEFTDASYTKRYELFCRKLVRERHYTAAAFLTSQSASGLKGIYHEPADDLSLSSFARTLVAHISAQIG
jgi:hypothetical protein